MVVGEFTQETQLLVVGGGPGGYSAAFRAAELGLETIIVDTRPSLGGACLHDGCVPSKTLLSVADAIATASRAGVFGVQFAAPRIEIGKVRAWSDQTIERLSRDLGKLCRKYGVEPVQGEVHFEDGKHVAIRGGSIPRVKFRRAIIATGSRPKEHPVLPFAHSRVLSALDAVKLERIPSSLLVIGGAGYMAVELAAIYAALGSEVTLIEAGDQILAGADPDLLRPLLRQLEQSLSEICPGVEVTGFDKHDDCLQVSFAGETTPKRTRFDQIIVAIGQQANTETLDLGKTEVSTDDAGFIRIDTRMQTTDPRVFAVGDVAGPPLLANKALHQGRVAAEVIAGWNSEFDPRAVPMVAFCSPQVAWCGLTEQQAIAENLDVEVRRLAWGASGRAVGMGQTDGMTKLVVEPDTKLVLGVGIVGSHAAEMIGEGALALEMGAVAGDLAATLHPHPSTSELIGAAAQGIESESEDAPT